MMKIDSSLKQLVKMLKRLISFRQTGLLFAIVVLSFVVFLINPKFLTFDNMRDILLDISVTAIAAVGVTIVILASEIDISIGSQLAVGATIAALYVKSGGPTALAVLFSVLAGSLMGFVNGYLVYKTKVHSIIITLGTMTILRGLNIKLMRGKWITDLPERFWLFGNIHVLGVPLPVWIMIVVVVVSAFLLRNTRFGREIYAVGDNRQTAMMSGSNVGRVKVLVFTICGALVGLAAAIFEARFGWVMSNMGQGFEFKAIGAAVIGGTSIFGGIGSPVGTFLGAILMGVIPNSMVLMRVPATLERTILGLLIILAVTLDTLLRFGIRRTRVVYKV